MNAYGFTPEYLTKDGQPWFPLMGEMHYSRYPAEYWRESLLKMKAGGVDIVSMSLESQAPVTAYLAKQLVVSTGRVTLHRLQDSPVAPEEAGYLGLDTGTEEAIAHMEKRASRSTDINFSDLTSGVDSAERRMALDMFSNLTPVTGRQE